MSMKCFDLEKAGIDTKPRFFARILKADVACPQCDYVTLVKLGSNRRVWDPRTARLQCMGCHQVFHLGIVAWLAGNGKFKAPDDQTPTVKQALELRRGLNLFLQTRLMRGRDTNVLAELPKLDELERPVVDAKKRKA